MSAPPRLVLLHGANGSGAERERAHGAPYWAAITTRNAERFAHRGRVDGAGRRARLKPSGAQPGGSPTGA